MHAIAWVLAGPILLVWSSMSAAMLLMARYCRRLGGVASAPADPLPSLSIVVPARNEVDAVEAAMRSLLALDYPDLEIIAVDDRSEDATGAILNRLAAGEARLRVVHITTLPDGWLGKCHALHVGSEQATGEWILFTDGDVLFAPDALRKAVEHARSRRLDQLALFPNLLVDRFWETLFVAFFGVMFAWHFRPWEVSNPRRPGYIGLGAFNLVRAEAYRRAGGHRALRLSVVDDMDLGRNIKRSGGRCDCRAAGPLVRVRWVQGLQGAIQGLSKNMFAAMGFSAPSVVVLGSGLALLSAWPVLGLFVGPVGARWLCVGALGAMMLASHVSVFGRRLSALYGLAFPVAGLLFAYTMWNSMLATYRNGGVIWRDTLYPLEVLRSAGRHGG